MQNKQVNISVAIITFNEEKNIERCIRSVQEIADEIVVVDSYSTDRTKEICLALGVRFIEHTFEGYTEQIKYTITQVSHNFVLSIDADEALSRELKDSILHVKNNWTHDGYTFNRLTNYCGCWIKHCGWYPDKKLRLYDRRKGSWQGTNPHYSFKIKENINVKHLKGDLLHYSYYSLSQHVLQIDKFTTIMAEENFAKKKSFNFIIHLIVNPFIFFLKKYFINLGFLDGYEGYLVCRNGAYYKFLKYAKLRELYKKDQQKLFLTNSPYNHRLSKE